MNAEYAEYYRRLYDQHWWWRSRENILVRLITDLAPPEGWGDILDVGCGDGLFFPILQQWGNVTGVEPDASMVTRTDRPDGRIHTVEFDQRFRPSTKYGLILMLDVLEHLDDPDAALRRASELLRPGGVLLATVPAFRLIWTRHDDLNRHRTRFTLRSFDALLRRSGFRITRSRYAFQALFLAKLLTRIAEYTSRVAPRLPAIPGRRFNHLLTSYCTMEHRVAAPLRVPFGSSLICVCEVAEDRWAAKVTS